MVAEHAHDEDLVGFVNMAKVRVAPRAILTKMREWKRSEAEIDRFFGEFHPDHVLPPWEQREVKVEEGEEEFTGEEDGGGGVEEEEEAEYRRHVSDGDEKDEKDEKDYPDPVVKLPFGGGAVKVREPRVSNYGDDIQ